MAKSTLYHTENGGIGIYHKQINTELHRKTKDELCRLRRPAFGMEG